MLKLATRGFLIKCDICRAEEKIEASTHAEAWEQAKRLSWTVRKGDPNVIHVCHGCPDDLINESTG